MTVRFCALFVSIEQELTDILVEIENDLRISQSPELEPTFFELVTLTQAFQISDLIIIPGRPSMRTTAFAFCIAKKKMIADSNKTRIFFFSLEMTTHQLLDYSSVCGGGARETSRWVHART